MANQNDPKGLYALVDCNNFFASCERVFNPRLHNKPVVILSNNDGCIIARSNEAKALGIPMGAPLFQYRKLIDDYHVIVRSANFLLYSDMSSRVMQTMETLSPDVEVYSIDEAFIHLHHADPVDFARKLRSRILQWTGIPVSLGIAPTKTLAKAAARLAKKSLQGFCILSQPQEWENELKKMAPEDVWGIGRRISQKLSRLNIHSAYDLIQCDDNWIRKHLSVVGLRTVMELRGQCCLSFDEIPEPKKSITCSRSYGRPVNTIEDAWEATAHYAARASEKLREQNSLASGISIFLSPHPYIPGTPQTTYVHFTLPTPTSFAPLLIKYAKLGIEQLFSPGQNYRKSGIILTDIVQENAYQTDLFSPPSPKNIKHSQAMLALDSINQRYGSHTLQFAAEGLLKSWKNRQDLQSPAFTTNWNELLTIHAR
ncbi:MAG: Y-family DNA polymerase [Parachlamydiales bacterium]|jgi:DNA polymerase V